MIKNLARYSVIFFLFPFLLNSCTQKDKHPELITLKELVNNGTFEVIDPADSVTTAKSFIFINYSLYLVREYFMISEEKPLKNPDEKVVNDMSNYYRFELKNLRKQKSYFTDTISVGEFAGINKSTDVILNNTLYTAPKFDAKTVVDSTEAKKFADLDQLKLQLPEVFQFDERITYKCVNGGRLPTCYDMYYYELQGKKFKTTSQSLAFPANPEYIYSYDFGILKLKK